MDLLRDMSLFVAVAEEKSFSKAALKLDMPTSTLSRRIATLEETIALRLFNRTTRKTVLTEAGKIYYERCRYIVQEAQLAHEQLGDITKNPSGRLTVSMSVDFGIFYMPTIIKAFLEQYPNIQISLDLTAYNRDILSEPIDVAIRMGELPDSGLYAHRLTQKKVQLYTAPDYLNTHEPAVCPADLQKHQCIIMTSQNNWHLRHTTLKDCEENVVLPNYIRVNNMGMVTQLCELGMGIAAIGEEFAQTRLAAGKLVRVLPEWSFKPVPIYAITTSRLLPAKIRVFIDFLVAQFAGR